MAESAIEWTDATWNPVTGCSMVSEGCQNCYAMRMAARLEAMGQAKYNDLTKRRGGRAVWTGRVRCDETALDAPLRWRKRRLVFVNSMSDLFHEEVPEEFVGRVWETMRLASWHTFQILTKRPERMRQVARGLPRLTNVWLGTSIESAEHAQRINELRETTARTRFISFEPLLGAIEGTDLRGIDWAIVGGESGPGARKVQQEWVESLLEQCQSQGVAFFFKQWGGPRKKETGRVLNGRTWDDMPAAWTELTS